MVCQSVPVQASNMVKVKFANILELKPKLKKFLELNSKLLRRGVEHMVKKYLTKRLRKK